MRKYLMIVSLAPLLLTACSYWGTPSCPQVVLVDCPEGQVKVCETNDDGDRCCTCDTPRSTAPGNRELSR